MGRRQKLESELRSGAYDEAIADGFTPEQIASTNLKSERLPGGNTGNYRIHGIFDGHKIDISVVSTSDKKWLPRVMGTIDGLTLGEASLEKLQELTNNTVFFPGQAEKDVDMIFAAEIVKSIKKKIINPKV